MEEKMVYLVTTGCYSDYTVRGVYSTEKKARRAAKLWGGEIESMALDDMLDAPPGMVAWRVYMLRDGSLPAGWLSPTRCDDAKPYWTEPRITDGKMMMEMWAEDEKHAVKIANERRIIMLAEGQWPTAVEAAPAPEPRRRSRAYLYSETTDAADQAYAALVARVGEAAAIARVRRFQDAHGLNYGDPIGPRQDYIDALNDDDYDPDRPIPPTEEGMKRYPHTEGRYEGEPCTCLPTCETPCEGYRSACDCAACKSAYSDAMDYADY